MGFKLTCSDTRASAADNTAATERETSGARFNNCMTESTQTNGADPVDNNRLTRVLAVDDEESNRTFAERVLRGAGYEVAVASDGPDALRIVEAQRPFDLFVIDILMPQMRGDELARRLRQRDAEVKVLYFTGYPDLLFEGRKVLWENEAFVEKPVSRKGLLEAVSLILFGHLRGPETEAEDIISSNGEVFERVPRDAGYGFAVASDGRDGLRRSVGRATVNIRIPRLAGTTTREQRTAHRQGTGTIRFDNQGPLGPPLALIGKPLTMRLDDRRTLDFILCDSGNIIAVRVMKSQVFNQTGTRKHNASRRRPHRDSLSPWRAGHT